MTGECVGSRQWSVRQTKQLGDCQVSSVELSSLVNESIGNWLLNANLYHLNAGAVRITESWTLYSWHSTTSGHTHTFFRENWRWERLQNLLQPHFQKVLQAPVQNVKERLCWFAKHCKQIFNWKWHKDNTSHVETDKFCFWKLFPHLEFYASID